MATSNTIVTPELASPPQLAEPTVLGHRVRHVARFYNGGAPLNTVAAFDVLLVRLTEAERKLAKVAHALNGDGRRAA